MTNPTKDVMTKSMVIPLFIKHSHVLKKIYAIAASIKSSISELSTNLLAAVKKKANYDEFENHSYESGKITRATVENILNKTEIQNKQSDDDHLKLFVDQIKAVTSLLPALEENKVQEENENKNDQSVGPLEYRNDSFYYARENSKQSVFAAPQSFEFPKSVIILKGLLYWFYGTQSIVDNKRICPFKLITLDLFPSKALKNQFKLAWQPIFKYLKVYCPIKNQSIDFNIWTSIRDKHLNQYYNNYKICLKKRGLYCFDNDEKKPFSSTIAT